MTGNPAYLVAALLNYAIVYMFQGGPESKAKIKAAAAEAAAGRTWIRPWANLGASEMLFSALMFMVFNMLISFLPINMLPFQEFHVWFKASIFIGFGYLIEGALVKRLDIDGWEWSIGSLAPLVIVELVKANVPVITWIYQQAAAAFLGAKVGG